jgi:hypothetical protein
MGPPFWPRACRARMKAPVISQRLQRAPFQSRASVADQVQKQIRRSLGRVRAAQRRDGLG